MTPLKTTLRGAIGIKAGLGQDELTIDWTKVLPKKAVTIAVKGDNGAGKSTLLNLGLSPWLNPPQLPGSMYDHFGPEGERILEWAHGDERYRSTIQYRQTAKTQSTCAFLHARNQNWEPEYSIDMELMNGSKEWHPVTLPDHTVSDGKARTYSACLEHILGSQSVYYLSAFRAQNAPSLSDYDDPKGLMRDLLHLDEPSDLADQAGKVRLQLQRAHEEIKDQAEALVAKQERLEEVALAIPQIETGIEQSREDKQNATEAHARAKAEYDHAITENLDVERIRSERRKIEGQMRARAGQRDETLRQLDIDRGMMQTRRLSAKEQSERSLRQAQDDLRETEGRIKRGDELIGRSDEIRGAVKDLPGRERIAASMEEEAQELQARIEAKRQMAIALTGIGHTLDIVRREGTAIRGRAQELARRATYVDQVPCKGEPPYDACPALQDAIQAARDAIDIEEERKDKLVQYRSCEKGLDAKQRELDAMGDPEAESRVHQGKQRQYQGEIDSVRETAALLPALEAASEDVERGKSRRRELNTRIESIAVSDTEAQEDFVKEEADLLGRRNVAKEEASVELAVMQGELDAIPPVDASDAVEHTSARLREAEAELNQCTQSIEDHAATLAQHRAERTSLTQEVMAGAGIAERANFLLEETRIWRLLSEGMRGVVDLSIEDAGPGIAEIANRLLLEGYGPRFTVRIITQRQNKTNDTVKEVFDISVIDSETGMETSIVHKSGGESVWLDKALTDAVALYHQEAAGMQFGSLFADEAEDGLTAERKQQFYRMDRKALEIGGFAHKFFVSHNPDAWAMADAVIDLGEYRSEVAQ